MRKVINKLGVYVTPRPPSPYGYYLGDRQGTWCKKCADGYWLYKAYQKSEGTGDRWFFIARDNLHHNFQCSLCSVYIKDFNKLESYKRWYWYNLLYYIWKDLKHFLYKCIGYKIISQSKRKK